MESYLAMLRGLLCRNGLPQMRADAQIAVAGLSPASPWRTTALLLEGVAILLGVLPKQADELRAKLGTVRAGVPGVSTLTTAEVRLLPCCQPI